MCRISGMLHRGFDSSAIESIVESMCQLQIHGGPDDGGIYTSSDGNLVLGNRRLSLLDLSPEGHMPMQYLNRYWITYNGEIYNYLSLKQELTSLGYHFHTKTDTEVILAAFAQWGVLAFRKLNGMFAFAIWDDKEKELFLVRDAAGIKPLYFSEGKDYLVFASEIRAFAPIDFLNTKNENWPVYMMAYGHVPEPVTTLKDVKPLSKGCFLQYSLINSNCSIQSFSHYSYSDSIKDYATALEKTKNNLEQSVGRHLLADAPIGVFLSGGLDSSIMTQLASKFKKDNLNTLSIYFEESEFSEKKYQDILIDKLKCKSHQLLLREEDYHNSFPTILDDMDIPSCDGINTWFISRYAASLGIKAVISGIGGDELYGGYPSFERIGLATMLQHITGPANQLGKKSNSKRLTRMSYLKLGGIKGIYLFLRGQFNPYQIASHIGAYENDIWSILEKEPDTMNVSSLTPKNQASWMEFNMYLQNQLLRDADVMSMKHGVEIRVPFLDDEFIRQSMRTDPSVKYLGTRPKQFLIDAFCDDIPSEIWDRPKMGFSFPFAKWLKDSAFLNEKMSNGNKQTVSSYEKFLSGKLHWSQMMTLLILQNRKAI